MKKYTSFNIPRILILLLVLFYTQNVFSQREEGVATFEDKYRKLEYTHKHVFSLPYDYDFIRNTVMGEVERNRKRVAPHFPRREDVEPGKGKALFEEWITNYPQEFEDYIAMVKEVTLKYAEQSRKDK